MCHQASGPRLMARDHLQRDLLCKQHFLKKSVSPFTCFWFVWDNNLKTLCSTLNSFQLVIPLDQSQRECMCVCACVCEASHTGEALIKGDTFVLSFMRACVRVCGQTYVRMYVHLPSFLASLMSAPVIGPSHMTRPLPLPVLQYKGWCGRCHALSQRRNTVGAQFSFFTLFLIELLQVRKKQKCYKM